MAWPWHAFKRRLPFFLLQSRSRGRALASICCDDACNAHVLLAPWSHIAPGRARAPVGQLATRRFAASIGACAWRPTSTRFCPPNALLRASAARRLWRSRQQRRTARSALSRSPLRAVSGVAARLVTARLALWALRHARAPPAMGAAGSAPMDSLITVAGCSVGERPGRGGCRPAAAPSAVVDKSQAEQTVSTPVRGRRPRWRRPREGRVCGRAGAWL
jgi:hypothetical protein